MNHVSPPRKLNPLGTMIPRGNLWLQENPFELRVIQLRRELNSLAYALRESHELNDVFFGANSSPFLGTNRKHERLPEARELIGVLGELAAQGKFTEAQASRFRGVIELCEDCEHQATLVTEVKLTCFHLARHMALSFKGQTKAVERLHTDELFDRLDALFTSSEEESFAVESFLLQVDKVLAHPDYPTILKRQSRELEKVKLEVQGQKDRILALQLLKTD